MSKYIIELDENAKKVVAISLEDGIMWTGEKEVDDLEELNSDYINEHFGDLQDEAYERGFEDGKWKNEDGCTGCEWEGTPFDTCETCCNNYKNQWTAKKQDDEIKVGDEVITPDGTHFVVFEVGGYFGDDAVGTFILFGENNSSVDIKAGCFSHSMTLIAKTGRHFDIDKILEEMRHD